MTRHETPSSDNLGNPPRRGARPSPTTRRADKPSGGDIAAAHFKDRVRDKHPEVSRSCGYPPCPNVISFAVVDGTPFKPRRFCSPEHQMATIEHRRRLRVTITQIDGLLAAPGRLPDPARLLAGAASVTPEEATALRFTRADLREWRARLVWEQKGMPDGYQTDEVRPD